MKTEKFLIAGNDIKMTECKKHLESLGYDAINCIDDVFWLQLNNYKNIILSLPTEINGVIVGTGEDINFLLKKVEQNQRIFYGNLKDNPFENNGYCYYLDKNFLEYNSKLTAQGVLKLIFDNIQSDITDLKIALVGYGKCGEAIGRLLIANDTDVTVFSRSLLSRINCEKQGCSWKNINEINSNFTDYDVIINTVPANIISSKAINSLTARNLYIEVASQPYGFDISEADLKGFKYINGYSLPGRFTPVSAGKNIAQTVMRMIKEGEYG